tara:strand:+ start:3465 stop:5339 length:1875 start_codon:yes stop_codon:yes gene_type:complete
MLESLRNFLTGPRLFIVIACCTLPFVFLGTSSLSSPLGGSIGTINGEDVSESDFQVASNLTVQRFKNIYGEEFDFGLLDEDIQTEQIIQELTVQKVLLSEARSLGFINKATEEETKKSIQQSQQFQIDGTFNEGVYEAQVNANGHTKLSYIDLMSDLTAIEIYRSSISSLNFTTDQEIIDIASLLEQTADIDFIKIDLNQLRNNIENTESELRQFYDDNQIMFYSDELRSFDYLVLAPENYKDQVVVPDAFVEQSYADYLSKASERTQIRISHVMIDKANYNSSEEAFTAIKDIENKLLDGSVFSELAMEYSEDIVSKDNGGDLEYFSNDIFPEEFGEALKDLKLDDVSSIVELEASLHILKITEYNEAEIISMNQMESELIANLIDSESIALMNDDFDILDQMILSGDTLADIGENLSKNILTSENFSAENFNFIESDSRIQDYIFSPDSEIASPFAINLENKIIIVALKGVKESSLMSYEDITEDADKLLSEDKAIEKQSLLMSQIETARLDENLDEFISAYNFITRDNFVDVGRNSSLIPREVLLEVFKLSSGTQVSLDATNGDTYLVDIININEASEETIKELLESYRGLSEEVMSDRMSVIINDDIFTSARVNLSNLVF